MYMTCTYVCVQVTNDIYNSLTCIVGKLREKFCNEVATYILLWNRMIQSIDTIVECGHGLS